MFKSLLAVVSLLLFLSVHAHRGHDGYDGNVTFVNITCPVVADEPECPTRGGRPGGPFRGSRHDDGFDDDDGTRVWVCHQHDDRNVSKCIHPDRAVETDTCGCCDESCESDFGRPERCECACGFSLFGLSFRVRVMVTGDDGEDTEDCMFLPFAFRAVARGEATCVADCAA